MAPKLNETPLNPNHFQRMNVALATQLFSRKVETGIQYLSILNQLPQEAIVTAKFCERINDLFDSFNGLLIKTEDDSGGFKYAVSEDSGHIQLWNDMYEEILTSSASASAVSEEAADEEVASPSQISRAKWIF